MQKHTLRLVSGACYTVLCVLAPMALADSSPLSADVPLIVAPNQADAWNAVISLPLPAEAAKELYAERQRAILRAGREGGRGPAHRLVGTRPSAPPRACLPGRRQAHRDGAQADGYVVRRGPQRRGHPPGQCRGVLSRQMIGRVTRSFCAAGATPSRSHDMTISCLATGAKRSRCASAHGATSSTTHRPSQAPMTGGSGSPSTRCSNRLNSPSSERADSCTTKTPSCSRTCTSNSSATASPASTPTSSTRVSSETAGSTSAFPSSASAPVPRTPTWTSTARRHASTLGSGRPRRGRIRGIRQRKAPGPPVRP